MGGCQLTHKAAHCIGHGGGADSTTLHAWADRVAQDVEPPLAEKPEGGTWEGGIGARPLGDPHLGEMKGKMVSGGRGIEGVEKREVGVGAILPCTKSASCMLVASASLTWPPSSQRGQERPRASEGSRASKRNVLEKVKLAMAGPAANTWSWWRLGACLVLPGVWRMQTATCNPGDHERVSPKAFDHPPPWTHSLDRVWHCC
jgi:hypothetical protein